MVWAAGIELPSMSIKPGGQGSVTDGLGHSFVVSMAGVAASMPSPAMGQTAGLDGKSVVVAGRHDVGSAAGVVPVGSVVAAHAKVRGPHDFQVVCGAGVADREVIRRRVGGLRVLVRERCVWVSYDLAVAVVFHHDHEHVVE